MVEAKKASRDANLGREQALQYAQHILRTRGGPLPFVFYTNGHDCHIWESGFYPPERVYRAPMGPVLAVVFRISHGSHRGARQSGYAPVGPGVKPSTALVLEDRFLERLRARAS